MLIVLFLTICLLMIWTEYKITNRLINIISVFAIPYMLIIPLNNWIMTSFGFYEISNNVILMIFSALVLIFIGSLISNFKKIKFNIGGNLVTDFKNYISKPKEKKDSGNNKFQFYKIDKMRNYIFIIELITFCRLLYIIMTHGFYFLQNDEFSGVLIKGILGHLFLTIYPLIPIVFYYWLKHKDEWTYLLSTVFGITLLFFTFVKYHSIGMVLLIYLFVSMEDHKYLFKGATFVGIVICSLFILSYFAVFFVRGITSVVSVNYYFNHLWNYIAGSLIYDNLIFTDGVRVGTGLLYKIGTFVLTPLNLFLLKFFNIELCPHEVLAHLPVGTNGEEGNVVDAFGYLFPSKGSIYEILAWGIFLIVVGVVFALIYNNLLKNKDEFSISICIFLTFFIAFSFFGTFYIHFLCWEVLMWSFIIPKFFDGRFIEKIKDKSSLINNFVQNRWLGERK